MKNVKKNIYNIGSTLQFHWRCWLKGISQIYSIYFYTKKKKHKHMYVPKIPPP